MFKRLKIRMSRIWDCLLTLVATILVVSWFYPTLAIMTFIGMSAALLLIEEMYHRWTKNE